MVIYIFFKKKKYLKYIFIPLILFSSFTYYTRCANDKKTAYEGIVIESKDNYYLFNSNLVIYYISEKDNKKEVGDILKINGKIKELNFVSLESEFNFEKYLENKNVKYELCVYEEKYYLKNILKTKAIKNEIINKLPIDLKEFMNEFIFLDYEEDLSSISSIISTSVLIFYSLIAILKRILFRLIKEEKAKVIIYMTLFPLLIFSSFKISILKAYLISLSFDFKLKLKKKHIYHILLMLMLLINPLFFKTITFYYCFLVPLIFPYVKASINAFNYKYKEIITSLVYFLLYLPFNLIFFKNISIISFVLIYLFKNVFALLYLLTYILMLFPYLYYSIRIIAMIYQSIIDFLSYFLISFNYIFLNTVFIITIIIFCPSILIMFERKEFKKGFINLTLMVLCLYFNSSLFINDKISYVTFINVGQGDCCLIHDRKVNILIDTGGNIYKDIAENVLIPYFKKLNITKIDHIFISHDDYDHSGALNSLINHFQVDSYVKGSNFYKYTYKHLTFYNLNQFGDNSLENIDSSMLKFKFYRNTYLFCGDVISSIEDKIIKTYDVKADILKVAHHGSNTSTSIRFLKAVNPKLAIISVGKNNIYKHPSSIVINRLNALNIKYLRTDLDGSITIREMNNTFFGIYFYFFTVKKELVYN